MTSLKGNRFLAFTFLYLALIAPANLGCKKSPSEPPHPTHTFLVSVDTGAIGYPASGSYQFTEGLWAKWGFMLAPGFLNLQVKLDGNPVGLTDSIQMFSDHRLQVQCEMKVLWVVTFPKGVYYPPAIGNDGTVYVGSGYSPGNASGSVYALSPHGSIVWSYDFPEIPYTPAIADDGTIYVQDFANTIYAFTPGGSLKWKFDSYDDNRDRYVVGLRVPAIARDGTLYVAADGLYALDPATGTRKWRFNPYNLSCRQSPIVGKDGTIYVTVWEDLFVAVNPDGSKQWETHLDHDYEMSFTSPSIDNQGVIYLGAEDHDYGYVYAFAPDGKKLWKYTTAGQYHLIRSSPSIGADGTIYVGTKCGTERTSSLLALSPQGAKVWEYVVPAVHTTCDDIYSTPSIGADGMIYFGAETGDLFAIRADGTLSWKIQLGGINWSSASVMTDGKLYIGTLGGYMGYPGSLFAVKCSSTGYANSPWPRFRQNNKNNGRFGG